jgi:hypothetical protein
VNAEAVLLAELEKDQAVSEQIDAAARLDRHLAASVWHNDPCAIRGKAKAAVNGLTSLWHLDRYGMMP